MGWGVRGLSVVCLRRGVVIVGLLCKWIRVATVRGAGPATHRLGVVGIFLPGVSRRVCVLLSQHLLPQSQHEHAGAFSFSAATAAAWTARRRAVRLAFTSACFAGLPKRLLFFFGTSFSLSPEWLATARFLWMFPKPRLVHGGALAYFRGSDVVQSP